MFIHNLRLICLCESIKNCFFNILSDIPINFTMNTFNKIKFTVNYELNYPIQWVENNQAVNYDDNTHGANQFKSSSKNYEFIKCPVNPQQTSFKYLKLVKKAQTVDEVYNCIWNFYSDYQYKPCPCRLENLMDIEQDNMGVISGLISKVGNTCREWHETLGQCTIFKEMVEENINGFKVYKLIFEEPEH